MAETIIIPNEDEQLKLTVNSRARKASSVAVETDQKVACVILEFASAVTSADYPALKTAIEAITGIQNVSLLVDGKTPASIPADTQLKIVADVGIKIYDL